MDLKKKLSEIRLRGEADKVFFYVCDGANARKPHCPVIERIENVVITFDSVGRTTFRLDRVTRLILEDADALEVLEKFKKYMREKQYKNLTVSH